MGIDAQERRELARAVRDAAASGPREFLDESGEPRRDQRLWKVLTEQMGLAGLLLPDQDDEASAGLAEVALVLEQLARSLAVVPALSSLGSATTLLRVVGTEAADALLARMADGAVTATVVWSDAAAPTADPAFVVDGPAVTGAQARVTGRAEFVLDGAATEVLLVPARCGDETVVVAVEATEPGVVRQRRPGLDLTRGLTSVDLAQAPATVLGVGADIQAARDLTLVLVAAEQVGIAQQCHDAAVQWAKERIQFDRPIGQFQAVKHHLVDLLMTLELARSALDVATGAGDDYLAEPTADRAGALAVAASMAKAQCSEAAILVADESLHIFGGIGFTWEHDAHLYLRRAKSLEVLFGVPAAHRARFASLLLREDAHV
ncbi:acyl-CoA/acyl-ACP dehydrogenase [Nocardia farcinica]|uniref:acyl-CoA dehydrogenase family protein n=1 Tax=Nocardia farcinica TaxID=37329 RepID=UPI0018944CF7|nr:acyl-CoA dehydrogenase family protein [Nocardia farcinica]MBF6262403.1 acyl-CoA/acyl-ACP dehydrogenase [Nocardia farcinica]MBF6280943.1 acyl-CoA/acyl-ACP dehydrogenase [Nocardia farcinica]MBF6304600.1 acyl-CoA/acyl-ACP dehydrogenase [Nocardia farcinica]MBF6390796.1 acyl-CoA/acyl-ACP dehydrogenase [Nocardia farcinica]MBF6492041.1 acyl-CoA/acyl-ACP dehydrogenase [Nocardia farcinica]